MTSSGTPQDATGTPQVATGSPQVATGTPKVTEEEKNKQNLNAGGAEIGRLADEKRKPRKRARNRGKENELRNDE